MKTKIIPFDLETAKKIQAGEIEGRIVQNNGLPATILAFDINGENLAVRFMRKDGTEGVDEHQPNGKVLAEWCSGSEEFALAIELSEEASKHEFIVGDVVTILEGELKGCHGVVREINSNGSIVVARYSGDILTSAKRISKGYNQEEKHEFKPFDKVLVRDSNNDEWICAIFSHTRYIQSRLYVRSTNGYNLQCIPYEGNEHLVGTTDKPKEE